MFDATATIGIITSTVSLTFFGVCFVLFSLFKMLPTRIQMIFNDFVTIKLWTRLPFHSSFTPDELAMLNLLREHQMTSRQISGLLKSNKIASNILHAGIATNTAVLQTLEETDDLNEYGYEHDTRPYPPRQYSAPPRHYPQYYNPRR